MCKFEVGATCEQRKGCNKDTQTTHLLVAGDADILLVNHLQLLQTSIRRVVVLFEHILLHVPFLLEEAANVDAITNVLVAVLVAIQSQRDGVLVLGAVGSDVRHLAVVPLNLGTLEVVGVIVVHASHLLVLGAGVVLGTGAVVPAQLAMVLGQLAELTVLVGGLEIVVGHQLAVAVAAVLEPLLVYLVHAILAVVEVGIVAFLLPL